MPSEDDPMVTIEYHDGDNWQSLLASAKSFTIKDAGVLNVPSADVVVSNKDGRFTDGGANSIPDNARIRITADVRGVVDTVFEGFYLRYDGHQTRREHLLTLRCKGYAVKLLWDAITYEYHSDDESRGVWTMKDVIEDFLADPDSDVDTGITLTTDTGDILTVHPVDDYDREPLLNALRKIAEKLGYDGYMASETSLVFKRVGSISCDPVISLSPPFVSLQPIRDWEEIRNYILPWGDYEVGHPPTMDRWTEDYDRWAGLWTTGAVCTIGDSAAKVKLGTRSIYVQNVLATDDLEIVLDISKDPDYPYVDCSTERFLQLSMFLYSLFPNNNLQPIIDLHDDAGNVIRRGAGISEPYPQLPFDEWKIWAYGVGPDQTIYANSYEGWLYKGWYYWNGSSFTWKVKKVRIAAEVSPDEIGTLFIDGLYFRGGKKIDPLLNPSYYPTCPVSDAGSMGTYGRRLYHYEDRGLKTFEQASDAGQRELTTLKDTIRKINVKKGAKTWARPHQMVTLNVPAYDIVGQTWRILELLHEWQAKGNHLRTTFTLVPQYEDVNTEAIQLDEIGGLLRSLRGR